MIRRLAMVLSYSTRFTTLSLKVKVPPKPQFWELYRAHLLEEKILVGIFSIFHCLVNALYKLSLICIHRSNIFLFLSDCDIQNIGLHHSTTDRFNVGGKVKKKPSNTDSDHWTSGIKSNKVSDKHGVKYSEAYFPVINTETKSSSWLWQVYN